MANPSNLPDLDWTLSAKKRFSLEHGATGIGLIETLYDLVVASTHWDVVSNDAGFTWIEIAPKDAGGVGLDDMRIIFRNGAATNRRRSGPWNADDISVGIHPNINGAAYADVAAGAVGGFGHDSTTPWGAGASWAFSNYVRCVDMADIEEIMIVESEEAIVLVGYNWALDDMHCFSMLGFWLDPVTEENGIDFFSEGSIGRICGMQNTENISVSISFWSAPNNLLNYHSGVNTNNLVCLKPDGATWSYLQRFETSFPTDQRHVTMNPGTVVTRVNYYYVTGDQYAGTSRQWGMTSDDTGVTVRREGVSAGIGQISVATDPHNVSDAVGFANV